MHTIAMCPQDEEEPEFRNVREYPQRGAHGRTRESSGKRKIGGRVREGKFKSELGESASLDLGVQLGRAWRKASRWTLRATHRWGTRSGSKGARGEERQGGGAHSMARWGSVTTEEVSQSGEEGPKKAGEYVPILERPVR